MNSKQAFFILIVIVFIFFVWYKEIYTSNIDELEPIKSEPTPIVNNYNINITLVEPSKELPLNSQIDNFNNYIDLRPNIFGIGFNLNNLIKPLWKLICKWIDYLFGKK